MCWYLRWVRICVSLQFGLYIRFSWFINYSTFNMAVKFRRRVVRTQDKLPAAAQFNRDYRKWMKFHFRNYYYYRLYVTYTQKRFYVTRFWNFMSDQFLHPKTLNAFIPLTSRSRSLARLLAHSIVSMRTIEINSMKIPSAFFSTFFIFFSPFN